MENEDLIKLGRDKADRDKQIAIPLRQFRDLVCDKDLDKSTFIDVFVLSFVMAEFKIVR